MQQENTIFDRYNMEISAIEDSLSKLYKGQIMEISGNSMDGKLSTNVERLYKQIEALLNKIENNQMGNEERIAQKISDMSFRK